MLSNASSCHCFTLCHPRDVTRFLITIPAFVDQDDSPWMDYLTAVYTKPPPLPVALHRFTFFYHRDSTFWPRDVEWPMSTCKNLGRNQEPVSQSHCSVAYCARWRVRHPSVSALAAMQRWRSRSDPGKFSLVLAPNGQGSSRGAIIVEERPVGGVGGLPSHQRDGKWLEVIRWYSPLAEGVDNYGCWFGAGAVGSGIWLPVGRTASECDIHGHGKGENSNIRKAWVRNTSVEHGPAARAAIHNLHKPLGMNSSSPWMQTIPAGLWRYGWRRETVPYYAAALGYDTIQCTNSWNQLTELVALHDSCMHGEIPLGGCAASGLDLRTGWTHSMQCRCEEPDMATVANSVAFRKAYEWFKAGHTTAAIYWGQVSTSLPALNCRGVAS